MTSTDQRVPPMGSEAEEVNYSENINSKQNYPTYDSWKLGFQNLLDDPEGYTTYYEFLKTEQLTVLFDCWYKCQEYRRYPPNKASARDVYSKYVRVKNSRIPISDQARSNLAMRLRGNDITETLLSEMENELYANLRDICYPKFLKSDFFHYYCETSGQLPYNPSDINIHKYSKPSTIKHNKSKSVLTDDSYPRQSFGAQDNYLGSYYPPHMGSDSHIESDKNSMADSRISGGSVGCCSHNQRSHNHDQLQDLPNFQPRTQRISQERRPMKPDEFAALLTQKLEKVLLDSQPGKSDSSKMVQHSSEHVQHSSQSYHRQLPHYNPQYEPSECDTQSWVAPPMSDRYSIAGQSSHSGSHSGVMVNKKAKELRDVVHHQLRNNLGECKCCNTADHKSHRYYNNQQNSKHSHHPTSSYYSHSNHSSDYHHSHSAVDEMYRYNVDHRHKHDPSTEQDYMPHLDTGKIYSWMAKNEKYEQQHMFVNPAPSPQIGRKKKPLQYNTSRGTQPIAQDPGMPMLTPPDTGNVLQEVKRVLEEPQQQHRYPHELPKKMMTGYSKSGYYQDMYGGDMYDKNSMASANWSMSDSASIISYNPSQVSTVPSSASHFWNPQGYFDNGSEVRDDRASDVRSHSTGQSGHRSVTRSDHLANPRSEHYSDVHSQSATHSIGSDNSKGHSKSKTVITYYYGMDPIPYRISIPSKEVTLGQFKAETKKGHYRFYFKTVSSVDNEVVFEEVKNDDDVLPKYNDKITGKVEKIE